LKDQKFLYFLVISTGISGIVIALIGGVIAFQAIGSKELDSQIKLIMFSAGMGGLSVGAGIIGNGVAAASGAYQFKGNNEAQSNVVVDNSGTRTQYSATSPGDNTSYDYTPPSITPVPGIPFEERPPLRNDNHPVMDLPGDSPSHQRFPGE
jgi:hypothetical protein